MIAVLAVLVPVVVYDGQVLEGRFPSHCRLMPQLMEDSELIAACLKETALFCYPLLYLIELH